MATIIQSIKVSAAVGNAITRVSPGTSALYTAPANGYAIVQLYFSSAGAADTSIYIDGFTIARFDAVATRPGDNGIANGVPELLGPFYVGPNQVLEFQTRSAVSVDVEVSGVEFVNG